MNYKIELSNGLSLIKDNGIMVLEESNYVTNYLLMNESDLKEVIYQYNLYLSFIYSEFNLFNQYIGESGIELNEDWEELNYKNLYYQTSIFERFIENNTLIFSDFLNESTIGMGV